MSKYISNTSPQFYQNLFELLSFEDIASFDMMLSSRLQEFEKKSFFTAEGRRVPFTLFTQEGVKTTKN